MDFSKSKEILLSELESRGSSYEQIEKDISHRFFFVLGGSQEAFLFKNREIIKTYPCCISKNGFGHEESSYKTPLGMHQIYSKIGDGYDMYQAFKARQPIETITPSYDKDKKLSYVISRIIWLDGLENGINDNTKDRYIYLHGTGNLWAFENGENREISTGCISFKPEDMIEVFDSLDQGDIVYITDKSYNDI